MIEKKSIYIETSIPSYLTARPSRDIRAASWQQITTQWWDECRELYDLFTSGLVLEEAALGDSEAASRRLEVLKSLEELVIDNEAEKLAKSLLDQQAIPVQAKADAIHIAVAAVQQIDYILTWNCRHINNATLKPFVRSVCQNLGYNCPEICTPLELLGEEYNHV